MDKKPACETKTTFFVPPSKNGQLARMVRAVDCDHVKCSGWNMKVLEKSRKTLIKFIMKTFLMIPVLSLSREQSDSETLVKEAGKRDSQVEVIV